jgi:hypothetical protein
MYGKQILTFLRNPFEVSVILSRRNMVLSLNVQTRWILETRHYTRCLRGPFRSAGLVCSSNPTRSSYSTALPGLLYIGLTGQNSARLHASIHNL